MLHLYSCMYCKSFKSSKNREAHKMNKKKSHQYMPTKKRKKHKIIRLNNKIAGQMAKVKLQ